MDPNSIVLPLMALVGWTLIVLLLVPVQRFRAAAAGKVTVDDFKLGESATVPAATRIPNRNLINLLELPVLFYALCLVLFVTQKTDALSLALAWGFVGLRIVHSIIHLSYNRVVHRLLAFSLAAFTLTALWLRVLLQLV